MNKLLSSAALALAFILFPPVAARVVACTCFPIPSPYKQFAESRAVFVGKVLGEKDATKEEKGNGRTYTYSERIFRFAVEEAFKGAPGKEVEVNAGRVDSTCYAGFSAGETYLIYAFGDSDAALYSSICSRTNSLKWAEDDVHFIRALLKGAPEPRVYGAVTRQDTEQRGGRMVSKPTPVEGVKIVVEGGGKSYEAVTDKYGRYSLEGIPNGRYKAHPALAAQYMVYFPAEEEFVLGDEPQAEYPPLQQGSSVYAGFNIGWNSEVSGRILDAEGNPVRRAKAALLFQDASGSRLVVGEDDRDLAEGKYRFYGLTPGRYLPAVTVSAPSGKGARATRFYYPGTPDAAAARAMEVAAGAPVAGKDITLPKGYVLRQVEGVVVWSDGSPAARVGVALQDREQPDKGDPVYDYTLTDEQGRFSVQGFVGSQYWANASYYTIVSNPGPGESGLKELKAQPVKIIVGRTNAPLRFVIPRTE